MDTFKIALLATTLACASMLSGESVAQSQRTVESTQRFLSSFLLGANGGGRQIVGAEFVNVNGDPCMLVFKTNQQWGYVVDFKSAEIDRSVNGIFISRGVTVFTGRIPVTPRNGGATGIDFATEALRDRAYPAFEFMRNHCYSAGDTGY